MHGDCWDNITVTIYEVSVITQEGRVYVLTEPRMAIRDLSAIRKGSGNKNRLYCPPLFEIIMLLLLISYCLEVQVLTSQPDIQEIPFNDPSLYVHFYLIVCSRDSGPLEWILLSLSYVRVTIIFTLLRWHDLLSSQSVFSLIPQNQD